MVDAEIENLRKLGVKFECNTLVGRLFTIEQMRNELGFDAVFIGTGAGYPSMLGIPGDSLNGVLSANELLTRCNLMRAKEFPNFDTPIPLGKRVAVIGAGNTAMDATRVSLRLGAEKVYCIYRRSRAECPARAEEVHHAEQEGVEFHWLTAPVEVLDDGKGNVRGMRCIKMELGEPDDSGRRRPVPVKGSEFEFECDQIVFAIGTNANPIIGQTSHLGLNKRGYIAADDTLATSMAGVFAGGDIVTGAATVIEAMGAGRKAARSMKNYLENPRFQRRRSRRCPAPARCSGSICGNATSRASAPLKVATMTETTRYRRQASPAREQSRAHAPRQSGKAAVTLSEHIVEIVSDSGEGAQRCGQTFGAIASQMGNGVWTVEIIPAEIRPPARSVAGGSGNRIRIGAGRVTNAGNETDLVIAFNEQVLLGRVRTGELKPGCTILLENMWRENKDPKIVAAYIETYDQLVKAGYKVIEIPMERECKTIVADAKRGKNMFALGILCNIFSFDREHGHKQIAVTFGKKDASVVRIERQSVGRRLRLGREESRLQISHSGDAQHRAANRGQRQHRAGARRARIGHGNLRHVPDHAGDLRFALSEQRVREGRRHRASGRGRDRRLHVCDRRLLRRQMRGHRHLRPRLFAQAGRRSGSR